MFDVFYQGPKPGLFPFEKTATSLANAAEQSRTCFFWYIDGQNDYSQFNFSYKPAPWEQHQIHTWPNQWQADGGVYFSRYDAVTNGIYNYHSDTYCHRLPNLDYWDYRDCDPASIDSRWAPDPEDPPYIYQFPVKWGRPNVDGPRYIVPGATEVKYLYDFEAQFNPQMSCWHVPEEINKDDIDFSWRPDPDHPAYVYHFGDEFQKSSGLTYTVPGATEPKFLDMMPTISEQPLVVLDIFYIDKSNSSSTKRYEKLVERYPHAQKIRYANSMMDTIKRCVQRAKTSKFWVISSENIYDDFNFEWHAEPWQGHMLHVFGSQWQKWSDTFLINRREFERCSSWCASLEEFPNLNFVKDQPVYIPDDLHDVYYIDHGNENSSLQRIQSRYNALKITRYVNTYLDTFKRIMATATTEYVWIISSLCDYTRFDFSWQPEPWQREMIHVFPSANQSRGDTFYIHVESFKKQMVELDMLDWFNVINYCEEQRVPRLPIPFVTYEGDDLITVIKQHEFKHPYTWFYHKNYDVVYNPSIWGEKDKKIVSFSPKNDYVLVPREAKNYISTQAYDYPYISKMPTLTAKPQDIIFISYDEQDADRNWAKLSAKFPRAKRLHGIEGMERALQAAADLSETDWYYAVFAKTEIADDFEFDFYPDMFQQPKHYIFYAHNQSNGLTYGYAGVILYNVNLVKTVTEFGIDYTMSAPHAVIPQISAIAHIGATPYQAWRSAFRESAKLAQIYDETQCVETAYRLKVWTTHAQGPNSEWILRGAQDGVDFYSTNKNSNNTLKQAFRWEWLSKQFALRYPEVDQ